MFNREDFSLYLIFFAAGFSILSNAQRYPELQHQLNLNNGAFGTYVSLIAAGAFLAFIYGSRLIHLLGIKNILIFASIGLYGTTAIFPHIHDAKYFILNNILFGFFSTINHISINSQGIYMQNKKQFQFLPFLAGVWSLGALTTSLVVTFISKYVSLAWNIDTVAIISFSLVLLGLRGLRNEFMDLHDRYEISPKVSIRNAFAPFRSLSLFGFGYILVAQAEFSTGDWSSIFSHNVLKATVSESALCFLAFMFVMAAFRMVTHIINQKYSEYQLMRWVTRIGSTGFIIFLISASLVVKSNRNIALALAITAYIFLGFGSSFMVPFMFSIATRKSNLMPGTAIASLGLISTTQTIFIKILISWIAQATNLTIALMIPALMLFGGSYLSIFGETSPKKIKSS
jgi:MFS family permease